MDLKQAAIFLSLVVIVMSMNLKVQQSDYSDEHRNVLYFKADEQSLPDHDTKIKPNFMLPNGVCFNSTYFCSDNYTCCPRPGNTFSCCPIQKVSSGDVVCPGGAATCPDENTCCQLATGDYGCCPLPEATCCSDHVHCCPQDYICNVTAGTCTLGTKVQQWLTKTPANPVKDIACKDNSHCPVGSICCQLESGQFGCCPLVSVVCPGGQSQCPDGTTCCKLKTGGYGCCPYQLATCCSDGLHCCPEGYKCDLSAGFCVRGKDRISWVEKFKATPVNMTMTCKDTTVCSSGSTCCEVGSSQCGCCPLKEAVCCSDNIHCCPQGYQCDVLAGACNKGSEVLAWLTRKPSRSAPNV